MIFNQSSSLQTHPVVATNYVNNITTGLTTLSSFTAATVTLVQGLATPSSDSLFSLTI